MMGSWNFGDFEITKRELAASATIIAVMFFLGFVIAGKIEEWQMDKNSEYYKAVQITETHMFQYGMDTSIGNAFVYGDLEAVDPITYPEIGGEYLYVKKVEDFYTMHTRTKTVIVNGETKTETETYWSWDPIDSEEIHCQRIRFLEIEMDYSKVQMPDSDYIETIQKSPYIRYRYYGCEMKYTGTIYTNLRNGTISNGSHFYVEQDIKNVIDRLSYGISVHLFWFAWLMMMGIILFGFYYLDNRWLETRKGR